ncbi:MAG: hypothetical protein R2856_13710 [Caldilineaceae bacterium]
MSPALHPIPCAERHTGQERANRVVGVVHQGEHRLGDDQRQVALQPIVEALTLAIQRILARAQIHVDVAVAHGHGIGGDVVGPEIEGAAGTQIEAGVVPMTGEDAVVDTAPIQREAHVRAAVVHGVNVALVDEERQHMPIDGGGVDAEFRHFGQRGSARPRGRLCLCHC